MINAKKELLDMLKGETVVCGFVVFEPSGSSWLHEGELELKPKDLKLRCNFTDEEFTRFINFLDFEYDNGYGGQQLFGIIWLTDNIWIERSEYDGSEWWTKKGCPPIPKDLLWKNQ